MRTTRGDEKSILKALKSQNLVRPHLFWISGRMVTEGQRKSAGIHPEIKITPPVSQAYPWYHQLWLRHPEGVQRWINLAPIPCKWGRPLHIYTGTWQLECGVNVFKGNKEVCLTLYTVQASMLSSTSSTLSVRHTPPKIIAIRINVTIDSLWCFSYTRDCIHSYWRKWHPRNTNENHGRIPVQSRATLL